MTEVARAFQGLVGANQFKLVGAASCDAADLGYTVPLVMNPTVVHVGAPLFMAGINGFMLAVTISAAAGGFLGHSVDLLREDGATVWANVGGSSQAAAVGTLLYTFGNRGADNGGDVFCWTSSILMRMRLIAFGGGALTASDMRFWGMTRP